MQKRGWKVPKHFFVHTSGAEGLKIMHPANFHCVKAGLAQTSRQVANGDECRDLATKIMKWRHFWRQGEGLGSPDSKQVFQETFIFKKNYEYEIIHIIVRRLEY